MYLYISNGFSEKFTLNLPMFKIYLLCGSSVHIHHGYHVQQNANPNTWQKCPDIEVLEHRQLVLEQQPVY